MKNYSIAKSRRIRSTPYTSRIEKQGVTAYTSYNHMLLPAAFGSLEDSYHHLKEHVQVWDVAGERQVEIKGKDAEQFVEFITPRDISKCKVGQCMYIILTEKNGGIVNDPVLLKLDENHFWLSTADSDVLLWCLGIASANKFDVQLGEPDVSPLSLQGPKAPDLMEKISGNWVRDLKFFYFKETTIDDIPVVIARSGWSGEVGYEIYLIDGEKGNKLWEIIMKAGQEFKIAPAAPSQISRIESGMLSYGNDMTLDENPFDLGMDKFVNLQKKADFLSKKALTDIHKNGPTKELIGIEIPGNFQDEFSSDYVPIYSDSNKVGRITSSVYSPRLKKNIALGIINKRSGSVNGSYFIKKNNSDFEINVCDLPFLRNK